jgi:hypothetical protein
MFDQFGLPQSGKADFQLFRPMGNTTSWAEWVKPRGVQFIYIMAISGGGGGGGGFSGIAGSDRAGGGGGGCSGITRVFAPACMVPDVLYVQAGLGGLGVGSGGGTAGSGGVSYVSMGAYPAGTLANFTVDNNLFCMSGAAGPTGGGTGTVAAAGAAGAAGTIAVVGAQNRGAYAMFWAATVGLVGFIGGVIADGAGAAATNVLGDAVPFSGGAGGSGSTGGNVAGGQVTGAGMFQTIPGGPASGGAGGGGYSWNPNGSLLMASTGGSGGGSFDNGVGGAGGKGGFPGSGGGGGAAGTTGGRGGDGGDGCVVIVSI